MLFNYFIIILIILTSLFLFFTNNPINSVLFLIVIFFNLAILLIFSGFDFLGYIFLSIYIGAIAIFFLFILMMVNIPIYAKKKKIIYPFLYTILIFIIFLFFEYALQEWLLTYSGVSYEYFPLRLQYYNTIEIYATLLYTINWPYIFILGYLLLIVMISAMMIVKKLE